MMPKPTFREALRFWLKLGFISFGGPAGQIAIMHEYLVDQKKWISNSKFLHALNYCMLLPGPEAQQLATYTGWLLHGTKGGLAAGILFILPSAFMLLGLSAAYATFGELPWVYAMFNGLKPAVVAIVILALVKIGKKSLASPFHYFVAIAAFICIFWLNVPFPLIMLGAILAATLANKLVPGLLLAQKPSSSQEADLEEAYFINKYSPVAGPGFRPVKLIPVFVGLWAFPLALFYLLSTDAAFWKNLSVFFTQAAFVTFGGAYAVLPYVAQVSVEKLHWLTDIQMIDGLALGETTPGPLIMVLAFVGFMAGYNHFGQSLAMGSLGLFATVWYTFLPSFLFIFAGAPLIERTQEHTQVKAILGLATAAVAGVILNLAIYLGEAVLFPGGVGAAKPDYLALGWIAISVIALQRLRVNMVVWIGVSAVAGLIAFFI